MEDVNIIICDKDADDKVIGILTVSGHSEEEVEKVFNKVKDSMPGEWDIADLLQGLHNEGYMFSWDHSCHCISV